MSKELYYSTENILKENSTYSVIVGQRSNGKTYGFIEKCLEEFLETGLPSVYIRRYEESITSTNIFKLCYTHVESLIEKSNGEWNNFEYKMKTFFLTFVNESGKVVKKSPPFLYCVGLNAWEHKKGQDRGEIKYIIFDEFLTRDTYLNDEFAKFANLLSSFIRDRVGARIIMIGNTVNRFCPYFQKFKIDLKNIKQGFIYNFRYGETTLSLEYCKESANTSKVNKKYFDFPDKKLDMIKKGYWEISSYPHFYSHKQDECSEVDCIFIHFSEYVLRWTLYITDDDNIISFISPSSFETALKSEKLFLTTDSLTLLDYKMCTGKMPNNKLTKFLVETWKNKKMFFATDEAGDVFENWMKLNVTGNMFYNF